MADTKFADQDNGSVSDLSIAFEQKMSMLSNTLEKVEKKAHGLNHRLVNAETESKSNANRCATPRMVFHGMSS